MVTLLMFDAAVPASPTADISFGGKPSVGAGFAWPRCRSCDGAMQFLGQVRDGDDHVIGLFMCQNDPGGCDEWEADDGGNRAWRFPAQGLSVAEPPPEGVTLREVHHGARLEQAEGDDYSAARAAWIDKGIGPGRQVLGAVGGRPSWLQGKQVPGCGHCGNEMAFVAQLEEGPDHRTVMNFGGGCAYVFRCACSGDSARMLWQC